VSDVFREVEEDLRHDRLKRLAKRYGPWVAVVVVLVIAGVGGWSVYRGWQQDTREEAGDAFAKALADARSGEAEAALEVLDAEAASDDGGFAVLAAFAAAELRAEQDDTAAAVEDWRRLANSEDAGQPLRDVALLLSVMHATDLGEPAAALEAELAGLAESERPLSYLARELTALLALEQGDEERAREILQALSTDANSPLGLRGRAAQLLDSLGGQP